MRTVLLLTWVAMAIMTMATLAKSVLLLLSK